MKKSLIIILITIILSTFGACKKKEEHPIPNIPLKEGPIMQTPTPAAKNITVQKVKLKVVVPPDVIGKWSSVKLIIGDKKLNKIQEFVVPLGGEFKIPDSNLTVKVGDFLPDFKMTGEIITSTSNTSNNPTVGVKVFEDDKQIFPESGEWGWLYAVFPTIHPFQHERFTLTLKEGIKRQLSVVRPRANN